jgi:hypothetical protein
MAGVACFKDMFVKVFHFTAYFQISVKFWGAIFSMAIVLAYFFSFFLFLHELS